MSTKEELHEFQKAKVKSCLRVGRDLANSRHWIAMNTGMSDRWVRRMIEELRCDGVLICNRQDGNGYYIAENTFDILRQYRQDMDRAMSILKRMKAFRKALKGEKIAGQISIDDLLMDEYMILEEGLKDG